MLEAFFNNEKTFSVFKFLLDRADDYISMAYVGVTLEIPPVQLLKIINNFELLDMIQYGDQPLWIKLDLDNPIVLSICILDELLEKYYMDDQRERITENGNESFQQILDDIEDLENMSVLEFVECLKKLKK